MRRFQTTPMKKLIGMVILFVFVPLFLLWYWVFFLGHKPGTDTMVILAAVAVLAAFLYYRYKKQAAQARVQSGLDEGEEDEGLPEDDEAELEEESEEEAGEEFEEDEKEEPAKKPAKKGNKRTVKKAKEEAEEGIAEEGEEFEEEGEEEADFEEEPEEEAEEEKPVVKALAKKRGGKK